MKRLMIVLAMEAASVAAIIFAGLLFLKDNPYGWVMAVLALLMAVSSLNAREM